MKPTPLEIFGTVIFALAVLHTFSVGAIRKWARGSALGRALGEVELVFGLWAALFLLGYVVGGGDARAYFGELRFTEPFFVFVIMLVASTRPVVALAEQVIGLLARALPGSRRQAIFLTTLTVGPLLGSLITEPAAMTVTALILIDLFYSRPMSRAFRYATLGLLFVNVSVGGTLTPFAAPPVLMVARPFGWDLAFMLTHFGWKAVLAVVVSTLWVAWCFRAELRDEGHKATRAQAPSLILSCAHLVFLIIVVASAHHPLWLACEVIAFTILARATRKQQGRLSFHEPAFVAIFLLGLVILGPIQKWWLASLLSGAREGLLFLGATVLTAVTDNAALTYLGSLVPLSPAAQYSLVAGAVTGGGLTVIANAPNPAGYGLLKNHFEEQTIEPVALFGAALIPTLIAFAAFWLLPSL